jgi:transmembrane sensor
VIGGAAAVTGLAFQSGIFGPYLFSDYKTGIAERRTVALSDGSSAHLNADSALSINFGEKERSLTLFNGQATFVVMPDPLRPFVVRAKDGQTVAIGTVFDIDIRPQEVAVTVVEGTVAVSTREDRSTAVSITADQQVKYSSDRGLSEAALINAAAETAWRRGKLIFNDRPLGDVVAEIERYRGGQIFLASTRLQSLAVTGVFEINDPDSVLRMIEETLSVQVTKLPFVTIIR